MTRSDHPSEVSSDSSARLDDRVRDLLSELPGAIAFQGLRRTLGVHPESLTRALRRLERDGEVEKTPAGYRRRAAELPSNHRSPTRAPEGPRWEEDPRVELRLSPGEDAPRLLGQLTNRWFGEFRWVGSFEHGARTTLLWVSRDGEEELGLELEGDLLRIRQQGTPRARGPSTRPFAAYELLQHVLAALRRDHATSQLPSSVLPFRLDERSSGPGPVAG
jgi:DNA-binding Lrp family transcriptional regulator